MGDVSDMENGEEIRVRGIRELGDLEVNKSNEALIRMTTESQQCDQSENL